jgi:hypothetical protein
MARVKNYPVNSPLTFKIKRIAVHYAGSFLRSTVAPIYSRFVQKVQYPDGVSANILTKNDVWLRESIMSIKDYVDEFIIIDSSDDNYYQRNLRLFDELQLKNLTHIRKEVDIYTGRVLSNSLSKYRWILHWDGDMVALDSGINNISNLFERIKTIKGEHSYYEIFFPLVITGSSVNTLSTQGYQVEPWIYSNCDKFQWALKKLGKSGDASIERAKFPLFYRKLYLNTVYGMHLKYLFPVDKLILKKVQYLWMNPEIRERYSSFENFLSDYKARTPVDDLISDSGPIEGKIIDNLPSSLLPFKGLGLEETVKRKLGMDRLL